MIFLSILLILGLIATTTMMSIMSNNINTIPNDILASIIDGLPFIIIAIILFSAASKIDNKIPPEPADFIASEGKTFPVFSTWYWMNNKGIWKDNKLLYKWDEIKDVQVLRTWVESIPGTRTFTIADVFLNKSNTIVYGTIRLFLNNGETFDIDNVVDPESVVNYIKNVYLNKR